VIVDVLVLVAPPNQGTLLGKWMLTLAVFAPLAAAFFFAAAFFLAAALAAFLAAFLGTVLTTFFTAVFVATTFLVAVVVCFTITFVSGIFPILMETPIWGNTPSTVLTVEVIGTLLVLTRVFLKVGTQH